MELINLFPRQLRAALQPRRRTGAATPPRPVPNTLPRPKKDLRTGHELCGTCEETTDEARAIMGCRKSKKGT